LTTINITHLSAENKSNKCIYDMIYLFTAIGFPPGGGGRLTCIKTEKRQLYTKK